IALAANIELLTAADTATNVMLVGIVPLTLLAAAVAARVLKARRPQVYAGVGAVHTEDGHIPAPEPKDPAQ
ncbi:MAG TPA: amino acid transporter, partial [Nakamurella sp.]